MGFIEALIGPALGAVQDLFGAGATRSTNKANKEMTQQTNQTNLDIARENNALQERMNRENNEFNRNSAIEMFNLENAYNNPAHQKQLLIEGGLNPATMYGTGGQQFTSDASTPTAATSGISPSMPNLQAPRFESPQGWLGSLFGDVLSLTQGIKNIADSKLSKSRKNEIDTLLKQHFELLKEQKNGLAIENAWNQFRFDLDRSNLRSKQYQEIQELMSRVYKNYADGGASHALVALREMQTKVEGQEFKKLKEQRPILLEQLQKLNQLYDEQIVTERTKQQVNTATAGNLREQTHKLTVENAALPEQLATQVTSDQMKLLYDFWNAGYSDNKYEFIEKAMQSGVRKTAAAEIWDFMEKKSKQYSQ